MNKKSLLFWLALLSGCSHFQPSHYESNVMKTVIPREVDYKPKLDPKIAHRFSHKGLEDLLLPQPSVLTTVNFPTAFSYVLQFAKQSKTEEAFLYCERNDLLIDIGFNELETTVEYDIPQLLKIIRENSINGTYWHIHNHPPEKRSAEGMIDSNEQQSRSIQTRESDAHFWDLYFCLPSRIDIEGWLQTQINKEILLTRIPQIPPTIRFMVMYQASHCITDIHPKVMSEGTLIQAYLGFLAHLKKDHDQVDCTSKEKTRTYMQRELNGFSRVTQNAVKITVSWNE